jgi:hypothetical protein
MQAEREVQWTERITLLHTGVAGDGGHAVVEVNVGGCAVDKAEEWDESGEMLSQLVVDGTSAQGVEGI